MISMNWCNCSVPSPLFSATTWPSDNVSIMLAIKVFPMTLPTSIPVAKLGQTMLTFNNVAFEGSFPARSMFALPITPLQYGFTLSTAAVSPAITQMS